MEQSLELADDSEAMQVLGIHDRNLRRVREHFDIEVTARGRKITLAGEGERVAEAVKVIERLVECTRGGEGSLENVLEEALREEPADDGEDAARPTRRGGLNIEAVAKSAGQREFLRAMAASPVVFAIGPAGTGKTYLAVRMAIEALKAGQVKKLVLCRPAVEAGEKLGYLPGDFQAKINPYLRPLYDALHELLEFDQIRRYTDREIIEIVPLAYMRGRTLNRSFIILDEGQNSTSAQMKMFLTRMGIGSRIVVTGDVTQVDLPQGQLSGLLHARRILSGIGSLRWVELHKEDIVRHPIVSEIVAAYDRHEGVTPRGARKHKKRETR